MAVKIRLSRLTTRPAARASTQRPRSIRKEPRPSASAKLRKQPQRQRLRPRQKPRLKLLRQLQTLRTQKLPQQSSAMFPGEDTLQPIARIVKSYGTEGDVMVSKNRYGCSMTACRFLFIFRISSSKAHARPSSAWRT